MSDKLVADGIFFVGIDVIGGKVLEINAESPGGMQSVERLYDVDVCPTVIEARAPRRVDVVGRRRCPWSGRRRRLERRRTPRVTRRSPWASPATGRQRDART